MSVFARLVLFVLFACATAISSFGQTVSLIEGQWRDIKPLPKTETARSVSEADMPNDPLVPYQKATFRQIGLTDLVREYGIGVLHQDFDVPVAIVDTGVSPLKDFEGRMDPAKSRTFAQDGGDPSQDDGPHGTAVTAIGFATANNGVGLAGINSSSTIISVKALGAYTNLFGQKVLRRDDMNGLVESLKHVRSLSEEHPLLVVNTSLAVDGIPAELQEVLDDLQRGNKVLIVSAADNFPGDLAKLKKSICVDEPHVLCVASLSGEEGQTFLSLFSAHGLPINYTARCHDIVAQYTEGFYGRFTGNSGCAPQVSASASLVASYMASKGRILTASELKNLMLEGAGFESGLISGSRPVRYPVTLNLLRLFQTADRWLTKPETSVRLLSVGLRAETLKGEDGKPLKEILKGTTYRVEGAGFDEDTQVFLNRIPLQTRLVSPGVLEFWVGEESSLISSEKVIYLAKVGEDGAVNGLSVQTILSDPFSIK